MKFKRICAYGDVVWLYDENKEYALLVWRSFYESIREWTEDIKGYEDNQKMVREMEKNMEFGELTQYMKDYFGSMHIRYFDSLWDKKLYIDNLYVNN